MAYLEKLKCNKCRGPATHALLRADGSNTGRYYCDEHKTVACDRLCSSELRNGIGQCEVCGKAKTTLELEFVPGGPLCLDCYPAYVEDNNPRISVPTRKDFPPEARMDTTIFGSSSPVITNPAFGIYKKD